MTGGLFTSSSAMARRFRWPPERLPVRVLAQDSRPRAVRISLTWGQGQSQSGPQGPPATLHPTGPTWAPATAPARLPDTRGRTRGSRPPRAARSRVSGPREPRGGAGAACLGGSLSRLPLATATREPHAGPRPVTPWNGRSGGHKGDPVSDRHKGQAATTVRETTNQRLGAEERLAAGDGHGRDCCPRCRSRGCSRRPARRTLRLVDSGRRCGKQPAPPAAARRGPPGTRAGREARRVHRGRVSRLQGGPWRGVESSPASLWLWPLPPCQARLPVHLGGPSPELLRGDGIVQEQKELTRKKISILALESLQLAQGRTWLRRQEEPGLHQSAGWEAAGHTGLGSRPARLPVLDPRTPRRCLFQNAVPSRDTNPEGRSARSPRNGDGVPWALPGTLCAPADGAHWLSQDDEAGEASRPQATAMGWSCWSLQAHEHGTRPRALCLSATCLPGLLLVAECPPAPPALGPLGEDAGASRFLPVLPSVLPRLTQAGFVLELAGERPAPQTWRARSTQSQPALRPVKGRRPRSPHVCHVSASGPAKPMLLPPVPGERTCREESPATGSAHPRSGTLPPT